MTITCKNCDNQYIGQYCNNCGQTANTHEINPHFLWHDIQHGILHFDNGIFYTIKELFTRPGLMIREFIEGKRVRHFKPFSFVIVLASIYGFLIHYFNITTYVEVSADQNAEAIINVSKITDWISSHYAFTTLLLLPITSLGTYWAFSKEKYNFIQHLVINAFLSGLHIVLRLLFFPLLFLFGKENSFGVLSLSDLLGVGFTFWALMQLFNHLPLKLRFRRIILSYLYLGIMYLFFIFLAGLMVSIFLAKLNINFNP